VPTVELTISETVVATTVTGDTVAVTVTTGNAHAHTQATSALADTDLLLKRTSGGSMAATVWTAVKITLKTYFDGLYSAIGHTHDYLTQAAADLRYALLGHTHTGTVDGVKLAQSNTHESPDTDNAPTALHHTLGTGANQACAGNDTRLSDARTPTAHTQGDSTITDPAVSTLTPAAGAITVAATASARRFYADWGSATSGSATVTGLTNGGEAVSLRYKTTGAGFSWTWTGEGSVRERGTEPTAAGVNIVLLARDEAGVLEATYVAEGTVS